MRRRHTTSASNWADGAELTHGRYSRFDFIEEAREKGEGLEDALLDAGIQRLRPPAQFEVIVGGKDAARIRPEIERALTGATVMWELLGSSSHQLRYATRVPLEEQHIRELSKVVRDLGERHGRAFRWKIKKMKPSIAAPGRAAVVRIGSLDEMLDRGARGGIELEDAIHLFAQ
jgi:hypothetical protein